MARTTTENNAKIRDYRTGRLRLATNLDETRARFSWGYHDGVNDAEKRRGRVDGLTYLTIREKHFDPAYAEGYYYGYNDWLSGKVSLSSEDAWNRAREFNATLHRKYVAYRVD